MTPRPTAGRILFGVACVLVAVAATLAPTLPAMTTTGAAAHAVESSYACGTNPGKRQIVLLVHGFHSGPSTWSENSRRYLASNPAKTCIVVFDYGQNSTDWVTSPHIGPALAAQIQSLASRSRNAGGPGKLVIVAHSMGGLAVRCAVADSCGHARGVASDISALVTFGTPNLGTGLKGSGRSLLSDVLGPSSSATCQTLQFLALNDPHACDLFEALGTSEAGHAFTPGSGELKALPPLTATSSFPVTAVAGRVRIITSFWTKHMDLGDAGDLVVNEDSALDEARQVDGIGGPVTVDCGDVNMGLQAKGELACWHSDETNNASFLATALHTITKVEQATDSPPTTRQIIDPFTTNGLKPGWRVDTSLRGSPDNAIDCSYEEGSPHAVGPATHDCGSTADAANACWASQYSTAEVWCLDAFDVDSHTLTDRWADNLVDNTPTPKNPVPLFLELSDGSRFWYRVSGAWGGRADGLNPAYGCANKIGVCGSHPSGTDGNVILSGPNADVIDKSGSTWRVKVGLIGDPSTNYPAPRAMAVRTAWFIAGHRWQGD